MEVTPTRGASARWDIVLFPAHQRIGDGLPPLWKVGAQS